MTELTVTDRMRGCLWGLFVGDALAMPVHWYYDVAALQRDFGTLRDYQAPRAHHPSSIMPLASTGRAGRGDQSGEVVGGVILKGRKHLWGRPNMHYHHGLQAGDNTLNLLCARLLIRGLTAAGGPDPAAFLRDYVVFMTAPDSHRDTYAESYHRAFFANYARGVPPVILAARSASDRAAGALLAQLRLTHRSARLERYALALGELLVRLLEDPAPAVGPLACAAAERLGFPASAVIDKVERTGLSDLSVIGGQLSPACYIDQSFPAVLYLAARYHGDIESALIANAGVGGDNCHRGAVLGAILGAALGFDAIPARWIDGLRARAELEAEIDAFVARFAE